MKNLKSLMLAAMILAILAGSLLPVQPAMAESTWTVTSGNNSGSGTLRSFVENNSEVKDGDTITFDGTIETVTLTSTLSINKAVIIQGCLNPEGLPTVLITGNLATRLVYISNSVTLYDLAFPNSGTGGAIVNNTSSPVFKRCLFSGNTASEGAAISNMVASPSITGCTFTHNQTPAAYGIGGAIYNNSSNPLITNCTFTANSAATAGGAIYNMSSSPMVSDCYFYQNQAMAANSLGGAVYNNSAGPIYSGCSFISNSAASGGGAVYNVRTSPSFTNCIFQNNNTTAASGSGGAINAMTAPLEITNCTFTGNSAASGGALYNHMSDIRITNSILYADSSELGQPVWQSDTYYTITYSNIQGGFSGAGNLHNNPCFVSNSDLHLCSVAGHYTTEGWVTDSVTSPCIDAGNPASPYDNEPSFPRGQIEMGAYGNTPQASKTIFGLTTSVIGNGEIAVTVIEGAGQQTCRLSAVPQSGHYFSGWSGDLTGSVNPVDLVVNSNMTVIATFKPQTQQYNLTLNTRHGRAVASPDQSSYDEGTLVEISASPDPGFAFLRWVGDIGEADPAVDRLTLVMDRARIVTAEFTAEVPIWYLDHYGEMEKETDPDLHFGSIELPGQAASIWLSRQPAVHDVVYNPGIWTAVIYTDDPNYQVEIGCSAGGEDFQPLPVAFNQTVEPTRELYTLIGSAVLDHEYQIDSGKYLAIKVQYLGTGASSLMTDDRSYLIITDGNPALPAPEIASGWLLLLGLSGLITLVVIRRRRTAAR